MNLKLLISSLLLWLCNARPLVTDAASAEDKKKKVPTSKILSVLHDKDPGLAFRMLHNYHVSHGLEQSSPSSAQRRMAKESKRKRERISKGGKKSAQSNALELSFLEAVAKERDTCEAELAALKLKNSSPEWLFVQQADQCYLRKEEGGQIVLESASFLSDTEKFANRPFAYEETIPTSEWFDEFDNMFEKSADGWPNTAMAMVDDDESTGVVVSVHSFAYSYIDEDGKTIYGYKVEQSEDQAKVMSLEDLLGDANEIAIDHCALFIDGSLTMVQRQ